MRSEAGSLYLGGEFMRRISSRSCHLQTFLNLGFLLLFASVTFFGQSLGEVARENRDKKATVTTAAPSKVITNADLPKDPEGDEISTAGAEEASPDKVAANARSSQRAAQQRAAEQRAGAQWRKQILNQKQTIASLQERAEKLKATIYFMDPNTDYDAVAFNRYQARQLERLQEIREKIELQKKKLEEMQETARHAGMHTPVYDP